MFKINKRTLKIIFTRTNLYKPSKKKKKSILSEVLKKKKKNRRIRTKICLRYNTRDEHTSDNGSSPQQNSDENSYF